MENRFYFRPDPKPVKREKKRSKEFKQRSPIRKVGKKLAAALKIYYPRRDKYLEEHPICEIQYPGCTRKATDIHHQKGRGIWLNVVEWWAGACRFCHDQAHDRNEKIITKK